MKLPHPGYATNPLCLQGDLESMDQDEKGLDRIKISGEIDKLVQKPRPKLRMVSLQINSASMILCSLNGKAIDTIYLLLRFSIFVASEHSKYLIQT